MGLFNFFDVTREGPGVSKKETQKTGIARFLELYFRKFWKLIQANLLYVLISLPVVTGGLAHVGLTHITRSVVREKPVFVSSDFMETIRKNWKQGLAVGLINLLVTVILVLDLIFVAGIGYTEKSGWVIQGLFEQTALNALFWAVNFFLLLIFTIMKYYLYFMVITFHFSLRQMYKNSRILAGVGYKRNLIIFFSLLACYAVAIAFVWFLGYLGLILDIFLYIFWFPAFRSYLVQYHIFPVVKQHLIDPYYKEHPGEDMDKKQMLNLEYEQDMQKKEEPIFEDTGRTERKLPKQYSADELNRFGRKVDQRSSVNSDPGEDDTI